MSTVAVSFPDMQRHAKFMLTLPAKIQQNSARKATTFASTPLLKAAREEAPEEYGALKEGLIKVNRTYRRAGTVMSIVGVKKGFTRYYSGRKQVPGNYLHLVLFGTRHSRPNRFLERAFRRAKPQIRPRFFSKIKRDLPKDIARAKRKGAL